MNSAKETDEDLDLPPADGLGEAGDENELASEDDELDDLDSADAFDDANFDGDVDESLLDEAEAGWLVDSEASDASVDLASFDVVLSSEDTRLDDDESSSVDLSDELPDDAFDAPRDAGEEGPLADDEDLREEDLPALDADDDGEVDDATLFDAAAFANDDELRWDDRAWVRVSEDELGAFERGDDADETPFLWGEDPAYAQRDATWRRHEEAGHVMAVAALPGDGIVFALGGAGSERPRIVRIAADGSARILAELEGPSEGSVTALRWDASSNALIVTGAFGLAAFRPR
jgi:hypothetical protein